MPNLACYYVNAYLKRRSDMIRLLAFLLIGFSPAWAEEPPVEPKPALAEKRIDEIPNVKLLSAFRPKNWLRSAMLYDLEQWFTTVSLERAISGHVAIGVKFDCFDVFNIDRSLDGYGFLLTRTFFTQRSFSGILAQIGVGAMFFTGRNASEEQRRISFIAELNAGWRFQITRWMGIGFQFGIRYVSAPWFSGLGLKKFHPIRGALGMEIGIRF